MRPWLLAGLGVRPLAQAAARAGLEVCAIDAFADRDTRMACAGRVLRLPRDRWNVTGLAEAIDAARRLHAPRGFAGTVAGGGLDNRPELRAVLAQAAPLAGSSEAAIDAVRTPARWFALLGELGAPHPEIWPEGEPPRDGGWLVKSAGGSAGLHVGRWRARTRRPADGYFQREVEGEPASVLFAASAGRPHIIGWQRQLLAPAKSRRWRYGGIVMDDGLSATARRQTADIVAALCARLPLRGLMGLDFLVSGTAINVLELNPRPTASVALHLPRNPFALHLAACAGALDALPHPLWQARCGEAVVYAEHPLAVATDFPWPRHCADLPDGAARFARGDPVCSVRAAAPTTALLLRRLERRRAHLQRQLAESRTS